MKGLYPARGKSAFHLLRVATGLVLFIALASCGGSSSNSNAQNTPGDGSVDANGAAISETAICANSTTGISNPVIYLASFESQGPAHLFVTDGDNPQLGSFPLNLPLNSAQSIESFELSPDNRCVYYIADHVAVDQFELFVVDIGNPGVVGRVNPFLASDRDVSAFRLNSTGTEILYIADQTSAGTHELYLTSFDTPGVSSKVNAPLVAGGNIADRGILFSPDDSMILYAADQRVNGLFELFLVQKNELGVAAMVNPPFDSFVNLGTGSIFSPDNQWIAYLADQESDDIRELFVVATSSVGQADSSIKMNPDYLADEDICSMEFRPDSQEIAYCADQDTNDILELYTVPLSTPQASVKMNPQLVAGGEVSADFAYSPDSGVLLYRADQDELGRHELYSVAVDSPTLSIKRNAELVLDGDVDHFEIRADSGAVSYIADQDVNGRQELYETLLVNEAVPLKLNPEFDGDGVEQLRYNSSGTGVFYTADQDEVGRLQLYRALVLMDNPPQVLRLSASSIRGDVLNFDIVE